MLKVRCRRCCKHLFEKDNVSFVTSHNEIKDSLMQSGCGVDFADNFLYISIENMPGWVQDAVTQVCWTKGRLNCPFCNTRIGSFNLVTDIKCDCGICIIPPIKLIKSKLDIR